MGGKTSSAQISPPMGMSLMEKIPEAVRHHLIAWIGEFIGTFLFLFFAFAATIVALAAEAETNALDFKTSGDPLSMLSRAPDTSTLMYIALAFGFSLMVNAWVFFRISGGLFNPAVTLAMLLTGNMNLVRAGVVLVAQIVGAIASSAVVSGLFPGPLNVATRLNAETSIVRGLFIEMFLTAGLVFTIFMLAAEKHRATFVAPIGIGLCLFIAQLAGIYFTGASLNPVRTFGPDVVNANFPGYEWIYWVGPFLGALLATGLYHVVKLLRYETANANQDSDGFLSSIEPKLNDGMTSDSDVGTMV